MSRLPYLSTILFWGIAKHVIILFWCIAKHVRVCQVICLDYLTCLEFYFEILLNMLELLLMHVVVFSTLCQPWLASIRSSWKSRPETVTGGSLIPQAAPLLLPCTRRCEAPAIAAPLLFPHARRTLHQTTRTRSGWSATPLLILYAWWLLLLLWHAWRRFHPMTPPWTSQAITTNVSTSKR
jgi:hypothetical protein